MFLIDSLNLNSSIANASFGFKEKTRDSLVAKVEKRTYFMAIHRSRGSGAYLATSKIILLPKADFITQSYWKLCQLLKIQLLEKGLPTSGNSMTTPLPPPLMRTKEYKVPKNYNVCLIATNPAGVDTICKTIIIPGVERISAMQKEEIPGM
jgi:hypothetical protein